MGMKNKIGRIAKITRKKTKKAAPKRKPGLWFGLMKVDIEAVTNRHQTKCIACDVKPEARRLAIRKGTGRSQFTEVYCMGCGDIWLHRMQCEALLAMNYLATGEGCIRMDTDLTDAVKAKHKLNADARKAAKKAKKNTAKVEPCWPLSEGD